MFDGLEYGEATKCLSTLARSVLVRADALCRLSMIQSDAPEQATFVKKALATSPRPILWADASWARR